MNAWLKRQPAPVGAAVVIGLWAMPYMVVTIVEHWEIVRTWLGL